MDNPQPDTSVEEATAKMDLSGDHHNEKATMDPSSSSPNPDDDDDVANPPTNDLSSTSSEEADLIGITEEGISPEKAELLLIKATGLKEEGNKEFKDDELDKAARSYRRAVASLKKLNTNNTGDEQVKALLVTLHTNLSMVSFKQQKYRVSVEVAGKAIQIDRNNVKALYRRAVANRKLGNWEEARTDLRTAIQQDASNTACKKELAAIKRELDFAKENQKKALAKAFSSKSGGGSFLYEDKEAAEKRKQEEERQKKIEQEELLKKRKVEWEDECVSRMAKNEPAISFEDWEKERIDKEKAEQKRLEEERKKAEKQRKEQQRAAAKKAVITATNDKHDSDDDDDEELTAAELASLRGYKQTSDGRTTSYFSRELSEEEKKRIGDIAPKRLDVDSGNNNNNNANTPVRIASTTNQTPSSSTSAAPSVWNQAGTWEEKDTTTWCTEQLRKRLQETSLTTDKYDLDVVSIEQLTGDASVAIVAGKKKRYIFDFHAKLKYEIKQDDSVVCSGTVRLPDVCSGSHDETEVEFDGWTMRPATSELEQQAVALRVSFANELRKNVQLFVQDFNQQY